MNVSLSPELERLVAEKGGKRNVQLGRWVVREAQRLLKERDELRQARLKELRREIAIGLERADRGELQPFDPDDLKCRVRDRLSILD
jgi:antitoxin ParD1/3/4